MRKAIAQANIDVKVIIPIINDIIGQEKTILEAHKALKDPEKYLDDDYRISQLQKLLCLLSSSI